MLHVVRAPCTWYCDVQKDWATKKNLSLNVTSCFKNRLPFVRKNRQISFSRFFFSLFSMLSGSYKVSSSTRSFALGYRTPRQWHANLARFFYQYVALQRRTGAPRALWPRTREIVRHLRYRGKYIINRESQPKLGSTRSRSMPIPEEVMLCQKKCVVPDGTYCDTLGSQSASKRK